MARHVLHSDHGGQDVTKEKHRECKLSAQDHTATT